MGKFIFFFTSKLSPESHVLLSPGCQGCLSHVAQRSYLVFPHSEGVEMSLIILLFKSPQGYVAYRNTVSRLSAFPTHGWAADCFLTFRLVELFAEHKEINKGEVFRRFSKFDPKWWLTYWSHSEVQGPVIWNNRLIWMALIGVRRERKGQWPWWSWQWLLREKEKVNYFVVTPFK